MNEVRNIIVGFELGEHMSQLCYYDRTEKEPVCVAVKLGSSQYHFPTCLSRKPGTDHYHYGVEAEYFAASKDEILIDRLFEHCFSREPVQAEGEDVKPAFLLAVFIGQALEMLGTNNPLKNISGIMVTVERLNRAFVDNLNEAFQILKFPRGRYFLQTWDESFYYYTISQKPEFWSRKVGLFTVEQEEASFCCLNFDRKRRPFVASLDMGKRTALAAAGADRDADFCRLIQESFGTDIYSGVFLVGPGFDREWAEKSIPLLCRNQRHVFYGNNLFCKGACYAVRDRLENSSPKDVVYRGKDMVTLAIGMEMLVNGVQSCYPLAEPGTHWYESARECEILLDEARDLVFLAMEQETGRTVKYGMKLEGLPERPPKATRIRLRLEFESAASCRIRAEDLGLGELYPSSGMVWEEQLVQ